MSETSYTLVEDRAALERASVAMSTNRLIGVDIEATSLDPYQGRPRLLQLATVEENFVIDLFRVNAFSSEA
ncbi:MAG TPA: hypothetical protein VI756_18495, partial [Blastocatellia bacterium]